ncbi:hypothetical protein BDB00DRAFT_981146 [Zychaea mexicana]|uniref:uncharacterized protein n=1 Tax=Zychaea mexicana TaxID=64656 RepID=UPI0022FE84C7|nr:uncharacterized protein BDB00DRAFT_981146 [Zychaea mexicana]KAI9489433.1 hypothetical protein BDB00DRAFT_981146 [Zychaea mexicana]
MSDALESRILRAAATTADPNELPEFPENKSDLPSDFEYDPNEEEEVEEVEEVEEIDENELLKYLDEQENPLYIAQRLFYKEVNTTASQATCPTWKLECLGCKAIEDLYGHGWTTVDGLIDLSVLKGAREEAQEMAKEGAFTRASDLAHSEDPFRDHTARDDWITWLDPNGSKNSPNLQKVLDFFNGPLHHDLSRMIRLRGKTEYQLAEYKPENGARYERHRDAFPTDDPEDTQQRRVTAIMYLNPGWTQRDGGELKIFGRSEGNGMTDAADRTVAPMLGRLVIFLSGVVDHAVLPSNMERFALTAWMR